MTVIKSLVVAFIVALFVPALAHAQDDPRVVVSVGYATGKFADMFTYPADPTRRSGKEFDDAGIDINVEGRVAKGVSAGYRFQYDALTHSMFIDESNLPNGGFRRNVEPESNSPKGTMKYQEFFSSIQMPKIDHSLILGFAMTDFTQVWNWEEQGGVGQSVLGASFKNLVIGIEGKHDIRKTGTLDYAGRFYGSLSGSTGYGKQMPFEPSGFELRGGGVYQLNQAMGVSLRYQYRTLQANETIMGANGGPWPMVEHHTEKKLLLGLDFKF
jgi:hypothetical protein